MLRLKNFTLETFKKSDPVGDAPKKASDILETVFGFFLYFSSAARIFLKKIKFRNGAQMSRTNESSTAKNPLLVYNYIVKSEKDDLVFLAFRCF